MTIIARKTNPNYVRPVTEETPLAQSVAPVEPTPVQPVVVTPDTGSSAGLIAGVVLGAGGVAVANAFINRKK
jgi:hypothetical protein